MRLVIVFCDTTWSIITLISCNKNNFVHYLKKQTKMGSNLGSMNEKVRKGLLGAFLLLILSFFLPFIHAETYLMPDEVKEETYNIYGFQHISVYCAFFLGIFVAAFGMGISRNKTINKLITIIVSLLYFVIFFGFSVLSLNDWGFGYSRSFTIGFYIALIGVFLLIILSLINASREPISVKSDDILD